MNKWSPVSFFEQVSCLQHFSDLLGSRFLRNLVSILMVGSWCFPHPAAADPSAMIGGGAPELELIGHGDKPFKLSSLRGKWVLLLFGATWSPSSEATALVCSNIRGALEGYPFEFVQVFDDPSVWDGELHGFTQFAGLAAFAGRQFNLRRYYERPPPVWYLIDPKGIVRAAGGASTPDALRTELSRAWSNDSAMKGVSIAATGLQERCEAMVRIPLHGDPQGMVDMAESILRDDPSNELAMRFLLLATQVTLGWEKANKLLAEKTAGRNVTDCTKIFLAESRLVDCDDSRTRNEFLRLQEKYPGSRYLQSMKLVVVKLPDELTAEEEALLFSASSHPMCGLNMQFRAFLLQSKGNYREAEAYFDRVGYEGLMARLAPADLFNRQGRKEEASRLIAGRPDLTPENANPTEAWQQMHANTVLMDWKTAAAFARRYQKLRPEKAQGFLVEWLIARRSGDNERTGELRKKALELIRAGKRYEVARKLLDAGREPVVSDFTDIGDLNVRFDTALLFVLLDAEDKGNPGPALKRAQLAFSCYFWPYSVFNWLRSLENAKPSPGSETQAGSGD